MQRIGGGGERRLLTEEPGVEPLELDLCEVDAGAGGEVHPRAHEQLVARCDPLVGGHRGQHRPAVGQVLQAGVVEQLAALEQVVPAADQKGRDVIGDDVAQHAARAASGPVGPVVGLGAGGLHCLQGGGVEGQRPGVVLQLLRHGSGHCGCAGRRCAVGQVLQRRGHGVGGVQPAYQAEVEGGELQVGQAALGDGVPVQVVAGDDREHGLHRRCLGQVGDGEELVDAHVGLPEQAHLAVGVRQLGGPVHEGGPVGALHRCEQPPGAAGRPGAPDVGDHHDVAAVDVIGHVGVGQRRRLPAGHVLLAVRGLLQQHWERSGGGGPGGRIRRVVDVGPQHGAVGHGHWLVQRAALPVGGGLGGPRCPGCRGSGSSRPTGPDRHRNGHDDSDDHRGGGMPEPPGLPAPPELLEPLGTGLSDGAAGKAHGAVLLRGGSGRQEGNGRTRTAFRPSTVTGRHR